MISPLSGVWSTFKASDFLVTLSLTLRYISADVIGWLAFSAAIAIFFNLSASLQLRWLEHVTHYYGANVFDLCRP